MKKEKSVGEFSAEETRLLIDQQVFDVLEQITELVKKISSRMNDLDASNKQKPSYDYRSIIRFLEKRAEENSFCTLPGFISAENFNSNMDVMMKFLSNLESAFAIEESNDFKNNAIPELYNVYQILAPMFAKEFKSSVS